MILVNGVPFLDDSPEEENTLAALLKHDVLISSSDSFKAAMEREISIPEDPETANPPNCKWVYLFQREYATALRSLVDFVGTDEATTCVGLAIWNPKNGMTSVSHMDSQDIVDGGLDQMLSKFMDCTSDDVLDVHIVGAFEDDSRNCSSDSSDSESERDTGGYSLPLCSKIIETLKTRREKFHLKTLCVLSHNTRRDSNGIGFPLITGFVVETLTGSVIPARFDSTSRCPDDIVRRIRVTSSYEDSMWNGKLLETYDTQNDRFSIAPCRWTSHQVQIANFLINQPDSEVLKICSTSPHAESPDFVENEKRKWDYLIRNPDWKQTFPMNQPRVFERTDKGTWKRSCEAQSVDHLALVSEL